MNSEHYGSWQAAANAGLMNCSDSTDFLLALAHACGLSGSKVHGHWNNIGHFWAEIEGHKRFCLVIGSSPPQTLTNPAYAPFFVR